MRSGYDKVPPDERGEPVIGDNAKLIMLIIWAVGTAVVLGVKLSTWIVV